MKTQATPSNKQKFQSKQRTLHRFYIPNAHTEYEVQHVETGNYTDHLAVVLQIGEDRVTGNYINYYFKIK